MLRSLDRLATGLLAVLGLVLIAMVALSVWNVISRYVFNDALLWADEVATFAMIVLAYLGAVICAWRGTEIRMDILLTLLPDGAQRVLRIGQQVVIVVLTAWIAWLSWGYVARILSVGMQSTGAKVPLWIINGTLTLGFALFALIALARLVRLVTHGTESLSPSPAAAEVPHE